MKVQDIFDKAKSGVDFNQEPLETQRDALSCVWFPESEEDLLKLLMGSESEEIVSEVTSEVKPVVWTPERLALWEATQAKWEIQRKRTDPMTEEEREMCVEALRLLDPHAVFGDAHSPDIASKRRRYVSFASLDAFFSYLDNLPPATGEELGFRRPQLDPPIFRCTGPVNHGSSYSNVDMAALDFHSQTIENMPYADLCGAFLTLREHSHCIFDQYTDFPESISFDEKGRYHSDTGPAVRYRDGVEHYYIQGSLVRRDQIPGLKNKQYAPDKEAQVEVKALLKTMREKINLIRETGLTSDLENQIKDLHYAIYGVEMSEYSFDRTIGVAVSDYENRDKPQRIPEFYQWDPEDDGVGFYQADPKVFVWTIDDGEVG